MMFAFLFLFRIVFWALCEVHEEPVSGPKSRRPSGLIALRGRDYA